MNLIKHNYLKLGTFVSMMMFSICSYAVPTNPWGTVGLEFKQGDDIAETTGKWTAGVLAWAMILIGAVLVIATLSIIVHVIMSSKKAEEHGSGFAKIAMSIIGLVIGGAMLTYGITAVLSVAS